MCKILNKYEGNGKTLTGEHGVFDYEKEFGFILRIHF